MGFFDRVNSLKLPNTKKVMEIPSNIKTEVKKTEINTVDVIFFNNDWDYCILTTGQKQRKSNVPQINLKIPEDLSFFVEEKSSTYNKTNQRELYLANEKSPFAINLSKIPLKSCEIKINPSHDGDNTNEVMDAELSQKMLNTLGTTKLIEDINEKSNDGYPIVFIMGMFGGAVIMSIILAYLYS